MKSQAKAYFGTGKSKRESSGFNAHQGFLTANNSGEYEEYQSSSDKESLHTSANFNSDKEEIKSLHSFTPNKKGTDKVEPKANQCSVHTQTSDDLKARGQNTKEVTVQTDIIYYDKRFTSKSKVIRLNRHLGKE